MTSIDVLRMIGSRFAAKQHEIAQLTLPAWVALAKELGVAMNDRDHAAKKLALRELKAEGKLA